MAEARPAPLWLTGPAADRHAYRVVDPEGFTSGQGTVFRAEYAAPAGDVAVSLKQIGPVGAARAEELVSRSRLLADLRHPQIARHIETFTVPGLYQGEPPPKDECDCLYSAAVWADGNALHELAEPLPVPQALDALDRLADAIDYLHSKGLTHRDLHPGNVVVDDGQLTVIDLGYTRPTQEHGVTLVHGAAGFVPPERFDDPSRADVGCDRWQVGMLGVYLLLGRARWRTPMPELVDQLTSRLTGHVPRPRKSALLLTQMLAENPAARPTVRLTTWAAQLRTNAAPHRRRRLFSRCGRWPIGRRGSRNGDHGCPCPRASAAAADPYLLC